LGAAAGDHGSLQVFASELAAAKGHDVDLPRNLAKSVTVE
jgi:glucosamine--fructose-6-phosphate aminotransferase (isomerizing)